jgi:arsenate reductase
MKPKFYQYAKCSTCRKARAFLEALGVDYDSVDIVSQPPPKKTLKDVLRSSGLPLKKLFNTSGQSYRDGNFGERLKSMGEAEALEVLAADGKLIKRPLLVGDDFALVGFDESAYRRRFEA